MNSRVHEQFLFSLHAALKAWVFKLIRNCSPYADADITINWPNINHNYERKFASTVNYLQCIDSTHVIAK